MTLNIISILTLGIVIIMISVWWVKTTFKEGNKALKDSQTKKQKGTALTLCIYQGIYTANILNKTKTSLYKDNEKVNKKYVQDQSKPTCN